MVSTRGHSSQVRSERFTLRFTPSEKEALKEAADKCGLAMGAFAGAGVLALLGLGDDPLVKNQRLGEFAELAKARRELSKVGVNLNQIAYFFNAEKSVESQRLRQVLDDVDAATDRLDSLVERLSVDGSDGLLRARL